MQTIAEKTDMSQSKVNQVLTALASAARTLVAKEGVCVIPGLVRLSVKDVPARKERKMISGLTKQEIIIPAKKKSRKVVAKPTKQLKESI